MVLKIDLIVKLTMEQAVVTAKIGENEFMKLYCFLNYGNQTHMKQSIVI
jgi:hypothetical protein